MTMHEATRRVVVAYDDDPVSVLALQTAAHYAVVSDLLLVVVHVVDEAPLGVLAAVPGGLGRARYAGHHLLCQLPEVLPPGVRFTTRLREGRPGHEILQEAEGASLLVVGSTTRSALAGLAMGSVTLHCVLHATCPVLVVPGNQHLPQGGLRPEQVEAWQLS